MADIEKSFDEVIAEAGNTLASRYAEAVAAQDAAIKSATTPEGTTPQESKPSTTGDAADVVVETPAPKVEKGAAEEFDPQKTLSRYQTQEQKDAALIEKDRELLKRSRQKEEQEAEIARLKAENEALRTGKPAATPPAVQEETPAKPAPVVEPKEFRPWLESVVLAEKPELLPPHLQPVHAEFAKLSAGKQEIVSLETKIGELKGKEASLNDEIRTLDQEISAYDKALKADPDSLAVKDMLDAARAQKAAKENEFMRSQTSRSLLSNELVMKSSSFKEAKNRYENAAIGLHRDIQEHEARSLNVQEEEAKIRTNWNSAIKAKVLDRTDLDADQKSTIIEALEARLNRIDGDLPADFGPWIDTHKDVFAREQRKVAKGVAAVADRESGNAPRTPANGEISRPSSPTKGGRKDTFDTTFDDAAKKFAEQFARR